MPDGRDREQVAPPQNAGPCSHPTPSALLVLPLQTAAGHMARQKASSIAMVQLPDVPHVLGVCSPPVDILCVTLAPAALPFLTITALVLGAWHSLKAWWYAAPRWGWLAPQQAAARRS